MNAGQFVENLKMYGRFGLGLSRFLRHTVSVDDAIAAIHQRLAAREENFLRVLQRGIFEYPRSPYLPLFRLAHCEIGDVRDMVHDQGLDKTLLALREAGIYVTFEECKGRVPIVRSGREFRVSAHSFDNPWLKAHYFSESGGSTGAGTRIHHDLDYLAVRATHDAVCYHVHGVLDAPIGVWRGVLPDGSGLNTTLSLCRSGHPPLRWFTPAAPGLRKPATWKFPIANQLTVLIGRACGVAIPWPELVPVEQAIRIARWAEQMVKQSGRCALAMVASRALRIAVAARQGGIDLNGVTFVISGEPVTEAKVEGIRASGASYFTTYGFSEAGRIARGCCNPSSPNDLHLMSDMCAVISHPRTLPGDVIVPAYNVTSLLPSSPKILLNAESDDYGFLEQRQCGCPLEALGLTTHLREIKSFRKLTGEGVSVLGIDILNIIEKVLPAKFGGSPLDYQLVEEEDEQGFTDISLVISPGIHIDDEAEVASTLLEAMNREGSGAGAASETWAQSGNLRIRRMQPALTARGKLLPLYVPKRHSHTGQA